MTNLSPLESLLDGRWTWVGRYVIGIETPGKFTAVHHTGSGQFHVPFSDDVDKRRAAVEAIERAQPRDGA